MKKLIIVLAIFALFSCARKESSYFDRRITEKIELRQLLTRQETSSYTQGSYFLIAGSYKSKTEIKNTVKMFGLVNGSYRLIEADLNKIRIVINNKIKTPYIKISYYDKLLTTEKALIADDYTQYYIYCSEEFLPETLLPINL